MRTLLLWLHILGAGTWIGANLTQAAVGRRMTGGDSSVATRWLEAVNKMSGPLYGAASAVILVTGILLVTGSDGAYRFGSAFVGIGFAVLIIGGALAGLFFTPQTKKAMAAFSAGDSSQGGSLMSRLGMVGVLDTLLIAFAVYVMVAKFGA
ncbi:MAG: hypothetical protein ACT4OP_09495 [Actinomycetota bacterium]